MKPIHPLAALFPMLPDEDLNALAGDIAVNGLREPIRVWDDQVIDGQNRQEACNRAGVDPKYRDFEGDEDDVKAFIISKNVARRHLTKGQQAMAYALIYPDGDERGRGKKGETIKSAVTAGFSSRMLQKARQVLSCSEDLAKDVLAGEASLDEILEAMKPQPKPEKHVNERRRIVREGQAKNPIEINPAVAAEFSSRPKNTPEFPKPVNQVRTINPAVTAGFSSKPEVAPAPVATPVPSLQAKPNGQCFSCKRFERELAEATARLSKAEASVERLSKESRELNQQMKDDKEDAALLNKIRGYLPAEDWNALMEDMRDLGFVA